MSKSDFITSEALRTTKFTITQEVLGRLKSTKAFNKNKEKKWKAFKTYLKKLD